MRQTGDMKNKLRHILGFIFWDLTWTNKNCVTWSRNEVRKFRKYIKKSKRK